MGNILRSKPTKLRKNLFAERGETPWNVLNSPLSGTVALALGYSARGLLDHPRSLDFPNITRLRNQSVQPSLYIYLRFTA